MVYSQMTFDFDFLTHFDFLSCMRKGILPVGLVIKDPANNEGVRFLGSQIGRSAATAATSV